MTKEQTINLIGLAKYVSETIGDYPLEYERTVGDFELADYILDELGFPEDNTVELGLFHQDTFCRDYLCDRIWDDRLSSKMTYRLLMRELNEIQSSKERP